MKSNSIQAVPIGQQGSAMSDTRSNGSVISVPLGSPDRVPEKRVDSEKKAIQSRGCHVNDRKYFNCA